MAAAINTAALKSISLVANGTKVRTRYQIWFQIFKCFGVVERIELEAVRLQSLSCMYSGIKCQVYGRSTYGQNARNASLARAKIKKFDSVLVGSLQQLRNYVTWVLAGH